MRTLCSVFSTGTALLILAGCATLEPRTTVPLEMPGRWAAPAAASPGSPASMLGDGVLADADATIPTQWWRGFSSVRLAALVDEALAGSTDLLTAAQRVRQADIALQLTSAAQLPGVSASAGSSLNRSEGSSVRKNSSVSLGVSYEVDLWGRLAADTLSAQSALEASRFDLETARITVAASVASTYFQQLALRERMAIARQNLEIAERLLRIVEARARNGVATQLDVSQQTTTVLQQQAALAPLELQQRQTASALGLPSSLLTRRPDLRAAEARLAAADANVAAARAALLPSFSLSASGGVSSAALISLAGGTGALSLGASLAQTLFDGGRRQLQVESARSQREVLIYSYADAVRSALKETDDGLANAAASRVQERTQGEVVAQAQRSLSLAELRYREGAEGLQAVLDAQRTLFSAQDALVQQRLSRLTAAVDLYRALGGGWQQEPE